MKGARGNGSSAARPPWRPGSRRAVLARELPASIERGGIRTYYQPRLRAADGRCVGMEALARWRSEQLGFVSPTEFIRFAEEVNLINPEFVLISCGFDACVDDPIGGLGLQHGDYGRMTTFIRDTAGRETPVVSALEGGYSLTGLGRCAEHHLTALDE